MLFLMYPKTSSSTTVSGGVHGKVVGIAHNIMTEGGVSTKVFHLGMQEYIQVGEIITEAICGEGIDGIITIYLTTIFKEIGELGTTTGIGEIIKIRVLKVDTIMVEQPITVVELMEQFVKVEQFIIKVEQFIKLELVKVLSIKVLGIKVQEKQ